MVSSSRVESLVDPASTAVLTMELQRGVVGPSAMLEDLVAQVAATGTIEAAARVCTAARKVGARVVHCTAETRSDGAGRAINNKISALGERSRREIGVAPTEVGSDGALVVAELGADPSDIVMPRLHGLTPFMSTSLDQVLRNLGIRTVVVTGVSINVGVLGMCLGAVDLGYQVVLVRDAVAGVPADYADAVIDHSLSLITTITDSMELVAIWS